MHIVNPRHSYTKAGDLSNQSIDVSLTLDTFLAILYKGMDWAQLSASTP